MCGAGRGDRLLAILTTTRTHISEPAGVLATSPLLVDVQTQHKTCVVPMCDSLGLNDFTVGLRREIRPGIPFDCHEDSSSAS